MKTEKKIELFIAVLGVVIAAIELIPQFGVWLQPSPVKTKKPIYSLRSTPQTVTVSEEKAKEEFYLTDEQRPREYIINQYEDGGAVVVDHATGLMWQKSGSSSKLTYQEAQEYVNKLNREKFARYDDWRLPTIPELMSLLEPEEQSNELYLNPIFDRTQYWCWSADKRSKKGESSAESAWSVYFHIGGVHWYYLVDEFYVRGVRS